jgi:hypothetical protein
MSKQEIQKKGIHRPNPKILNQSNSTKNGLSKGKTMSFLGVGKERSKERSIYDKPTFSSKQKRSVSPKKEKTQNVFYQSL